MVCNWSSVFKLQYLCAVVFLIYVLKGNTERMAVTGQKPIIKPSFLSYF